MGALGGGSGALGGWCVAALLGVLAGINQHLCHPLPPTGVSQGDVSSPDDIFRHPTPPPAQRQQGGKRAFCHGPVCRALCGGGGTLELARGSGHGHPTCTWGSWPCSWRGKGRVGSSGGMGAALLSACHTGAGAGTSLVCFMPHVGLIHPGMGSPSSIPGGSCAPQGVLSPSDGAGTGGPLAPQWSLWPVTEQPGKGWDTVKKKF